MNIRLGLSIWRDGLTASEWIEQAAQTMERVNGAVV